MADAGRKQMQVVLQCEQADAGAVCGVDLARCAVLLVDLVHVFDELHDLCVRQVFIQPASELPKPRMMLQGLQPMQLLTLPADMGQMR